MSDPAHDPSSDAAKAAALREAEEARWLEERRAILQVLKLWPVPPGKFPWLTLLVVVASVVITTLSRTAHERIFDLFFAAGTEVWLERKWWGLLGSVFIHGDLLHLLFNCYWIWILGRLLERELGVVRYGGLFLAASWLGSIAELCWSGQPGIGLSGVAYAFFGFLFVSRAHHLDFSRVLPDSTVRLMFGWLVVCFVLTYAGVFRVANFAHVAGLVTGCLIGWAAYPNAWQRRARGATVAFIVLSFGPLLWAPWRQEWLIAEALRALKQQDQSRALVRLEKILEHQPANAWALKTAALISLQRGEYVLARNWLSRVAQDSEDVEVLNSLAWLLATCPVAEVRDGPKAVGYARRACASSEWKNAAVIDTLAVAYAEAGDFVAAEKWALKALENPGKDAAAFQDHLDFFRAQKPWRESVPAAPPSL